MPSLPLKRPNEDFYEAVVSNNIAKLQQYLQDGGYMVDIVKGYGRTSMTALTLACQHGSYDAARVLLASGCDVNKCPRFWDAGPLQFAAANGHVLLVDLLLKHGARVNAVDRGGVTSLMTACQNGHVVIAQMLLRYGGNIDQYAVFEPLPAEVRKAMSAEALSSADVAEIKDPYEGNNAFLKACWKGRTDLVDMLVSHGCTIDTPNTGGNMGLHVACREGHFDIVKKLLKHGINVNVFNNRRQTAFHITLCKMFRAASGGDLSPVTRAQEVEMYAGIARLLLHSGCDTTLVDAEGSSPIFLLLTGDFKELHERVGHFRLELLQLLNACTTNINAKQLPSSEQIPLRLREEFPGLLLRLQNCCNQPRRLKYLSRCAVRKTLTNIYSCQADIRSLGLPVVLHKYLSFEITF